LAAFQFSRASTGYGSGANSAILGCVVQRYSADMLKPVGREQPASAQRPR